MTSKSELATIGQFKVVPITMPPATTIVSPPLLSQHQHIFYTDLQDTVPTDQMAAIHHIFMRSHASRNESDHLPSDRTLFLVNLPVDTTANHLKRLFRRCGKIQRVEWGCKQNTSEDMESISAHGLLRTGSNAHVVFEDAESVQIALEMKARRRQWTGQDCGENEDDEQSAVIGLGRWILDHLQMYPDLSKLQQKVDDAMSLFDQEEMDAIMEQKNRMGKPDEDGFITVSRTRGRRNGDVPTSTVDVVQPKKKSKELVDFYRFQRREEKRNQLSELRRKFEQDKAKIAQLKEKKRFKPYKSISL